LNFYFYGVFGGFFCEGFIPIDGDFFYVWEERECVLVLGIDLLYGGVGGAVDFYFYDVEGLLIWDGDDEVCSSLESWDFSVIVDFIHFEGGS